MFSIQVFEGYYNRENEYENMIYGSCNVTSGVVELFSEGNIVSIAFRSNDNDATARGFLLQYRLGWSWERCPVWLLFLYMFIRLPYIFTVNFSVCIAEVRVFEPGYISTPNFPDHYYNDEWCLAVLGTLPGRQVQIQFTDFDIEESSLCSKDNVTVCIQSSSIHVKVMGKMVACVRFIADLRRCFWRGCRRAWFRLWGLQHFNVYHAHRCLPLDQLAPVRTLPFKTATRRDPASSSTTRSVRNINNMPLLCMNYIFAFDIYDWVLSFQFTMKVSNILFIFLRLLCLKSLTNH